MKYDYSNRHILADLILDGKIPVPFQLRIELTNYCNLRCRFCPTGHPDLQRKFGVQKGQMSKETFVHLVHDLTMLPEKIKVIHWYLYGEPLLHPRLIPSMKIVVQKDVAERHFLKTNGLLLTHQVSDALIATGITDIGISVEGVTDRHYLDLCDVSMDYRKLVDEVAYLFMMRKQCRIHVKLIDISYTKEEHQKFLDDFAPISSSIDIESPMGWNRTKEFDFRLGDRSSESFDHVPLQKRTVCPYAFYTMMINWDGRATCCCTDWTCATEVGDINQTSLLDIWNGQRMRNFRLMHLEGRRNENPACGDCHFIECAPHQDDLDDRASAIRTALLIPEPVSRWKGFSPVKMDKRLTQCQSTAQ